MRNGRATKQEAELRIKLQAADAALGEAEAHIAELHRQMDRANASAVRIARCVNVLILADQMARRRA